MRFLNRTRPLLPAVNLQRPQQLRLLAVLAASAMVLASVGLASANVIESFTTQVVDAGGNPVTTITVGTPVHDSATLAVSGSETVCGGDTSGTPCPSPAASITFRLFAGSDCTGQPISTDLPTTLPNTLTATVTSSTSTLTVAGNYAFQAEYSGAPPFYPQTTSACEPFTVKPGQITQTIAGHIFDCTSGSATTTEVPGGMLGATGPQTVATQANPLNPSSVAAGTYTMSASAPSGFQFVQCGGTATITSPTSATESVNVPSGGAGVGIFYVAKVTGVCPQGDKLNFRWHYSANGTSGSWSGTQSTVCPGSISEGPQAMEGDLKLAPGTTLMAGYDFTSPGNNTTFSVTVSNPQVVFTLRCVSGAISSQTSLTVTMPTTTYSVTGSGWFPSGDQHSPLVYQGSVAIPDVCGGGQVRLDKGGTFSAGVQ